MTRINSGVSVHRLTDEHLLAEHREIKRVPGITLRNTASPERFVLGNGHVRFFYKKLRYLFERYKKIHNECIRRGFDVADYSENFLRHADTERWCDYMPTNDEAMIIERIKKRIQDSPKSQFHYYGNAIDKSTAIRILQDRND